MIVIFVDFPIAMLMFYYYYYIYNYKLYIQHPEGSIRSPHAGTQCAQAWCRSQKWPLGQLNDFDVLYDGQKKGNIMGYPLVN